MHDRWTESANNGGNCNSINLPYFGNAVEKVPSCSNYWWHGRVTLVVDCGFCPKFWARGGDLQRPFAAL